MEGAAERSFACFVFDFFGRVFAYLLGRSVLIICNFSWFGVPLPPLIGEGRLFVENWPQGWTTIEVFLFCLFIL
jgi:hypothetical protein